MSRRPSSLRDKASAVAGAVVGGDKLLDPGQLDGGVFRLRRSGRLTADSPGGAAVLFPQSLPGTLKCTRAAERPTCSRHTSEGVCAPGSEVIGRGGFVESGIISAEALSADLYPG
jgi:hypothetical protein